MTPEFRVNTFTTSGQSGSSVTVLSDGGHVVVWTSDAQDGSYPGVYGQRYNVSGVKVGAEFLINGTTSGYQHEPSVSAMVDGGFIVVWQGNGAPDASDIYMQRYDAAGTKVGVETLINVELPSGLVTPAVTGLSNGGFVVTYENYTAGEIVARLYGADGQPRGDEVSWVNTVTSYRQNLPQVWPYRVAAMSSSGRRTSRMRISLPGFMTPMVPRSRESLLSIPTPLSVSTPPA